MADEKSAVLGIRLDTEERKRFDEFVSEEGKSNKEFIGTLLNLYELNKGKVKNINLVGDIEELEGFTSKIQQIFVNIINKLEGQKSSILEDRDKDLQIYKEKVNKLQLENDSLKLDNSMVCEKLTNANNVLLTLNRQVEQLQANLIDKVTIVDEYKGKNDMLLGQLKQYEKYSSEIEAIKGLLADARAKEIEKDNVITNMNNSIINLNTTIQERDNKHQEDLKIFEAKSKESLERVADKATFVADKAILTLKQDHQKVLEQAQDKHNKEVDIYQAKYKNLLEELEQLRNIKDPKSKKKLDILQESL